MSFWCITTYYNPCNYQVRLDNYKIFRRLLNIPLLTVEWSASGQFQLSSEDADILIQISSADILWQKERLLNVAIAALPKDCQNVAWLDCDILFADPTWSQKAEKMLTNKVVIQPYKNLFYFSHESLSKIKPSDATFSPHINYEKDIIHHRKSMIFCIENNTYDPKTIITIPRAENLPSIGIAWAANTEFLRNIQFYDANIVGGGDSLFLYAILGYPNYLIPRMTTPHFEHYYDWAKKIQPLTKGQIDYLKTDIYHLWHGDFQNRHYLDRHSWLQQADFDPTQDIAIAPSGCWQWSSDKPKLHEQIRKYFYLRKEDG